MIFYVGLDDVHFAEHFEHSFISVNRLRRRKKAGRFTPKKWILDSGAFTEISNHGDYRAGPLEYVAEIERWRHVGDMELAVTQDWMCEPFIVAKTGLSVLTHQKLTVTRYKIIAGATDAPIMPVLQGFRRAEYLEHLDQYGALLQPGARVGVGSVCKRNTNIAEIEDILGAIHAARPDLRLHGFGVKRTALRSAFVCDCLFSADSMAWSFAARWEGRDAHDWQEAARFAAQIEEQPKQISLFTM
jgi:hypothetical protein